MREERRNYLVVGVFAVAMLFGLIAWLSVLSGFSGATRSYVVVYDSVLGLAKGTQVLYEGFPVGEIADIDPLPDGDSERRFRVELAVRRGWEIPSDAQAHVVAPGFLSAVVIDIRGGESRESLAEGGEIRAAARSNVVDAVSQAAVTITDIVESRVDPLLSAVGEDTPEILANLRSFSSELNQSGTRLNEMLDDENMGRVDAILANTESASANFDRFSTELAATRGELDLFLTRVNALLDPETGKLDHAIEDLHTTLESLARHSDAIAHDMEVTSRNLAEFSRQIRENPGLILRGRDGDAP